jgi:hypothetical protein
VVDVQQSNAGRKRGGQRRHGEQRSGATPEIVQRRVLSRERVDRCGVRELYVVSEWLV